VHRSTDVNSVTGLALHEHSHFTAQIDFVGGTVTVNGAINIMQRPGVGSVILNSGRKIFDSETGLPLVLRGPDRADDEDFCRALAPSEPHSLLSTLQWRTVAGHLGPLLGTGHRPSPPVYLCRQGGIHPPPRLAVRPRLSQSIRDLGQRLRLGQEVVGRSGACR
jgi:hypothetical protein